MSISQANQEIATHMQAARERRAQAAAAISRVYALRRLEERLEELNLRGHRHLPGDFLFPALSASDLLQLLACRHSITEMIRLVLHNLLPQPAPLPGDEDQGNPDEVTRIRKGELVLVPLAARRPAHNPLLNRAFTGKCEWCGRPLQLTAGRPPVYCQDNGGSCKRAAKAARAARREQTA